MRAVERRASKRAVKWWSHSRENMAWARGCEGALAELPRATGSLQTPGRLSIFFFELRQPQRAQNAESKLFFCRNSCFVQIAAAATLKKKREN